jgi:hypothetical protein
LEYPVLVERKLSRNSVVFAIVLLSFAWNVFLLIGVVLNLGFVHTRAAGGQFTDFPMGIRVAYVLQLALVTYQVWVFKLIFHSNPVKPNWIPKLFFTLGILGILANAASRSSNERWNVIPAAIITWAFWYYGIKKLKSDV